MSGKGDSPRPVDRDKFNENYDRIFGGKVKKVGYYTFPRSGRTWMFRMMRKHGVKANVSAPSDDDEWILDHDGCLEKYPDRIGITVLRDPVRSIYSWYWLDTVDRGIDTPEYFREKLSHYTEFWKWWARANVLSGDCHVLLYEDVCERTEAVVKWICDMIGVQFNKDHVIPSRPQKSREDFQYHSEELAKEIIDRLQPEYDLVYVDPGVRTVKICQ